LRELVYIIHQTQILFAIIMGLLQTPNNIKNIDARNVILVFHFFINRVAINKLLFKRYVKI